LCYIALIYFFSYFWMAITFNPKEIAENLKDLARSFPAIDPDAGRPEYLEKVMIPHTYVGAAFLAIVAIVPTVISASMHVQPNIASFYGGTGLLIAGERGLRPDPENRQPPGDARLPGTARTLERLAQGRVTRHQQAAGRKRPAGL